MKPMFPQRIISLVPSQTELLYDLGLGERVVGITKFCVRPQEWYATKTRVGGTKTLNIPRIKALAPDLILANKEENDRDQVSQLSEFCKVWTSDIPHLDAALEMIATIGQLTGAMDKIEALISEIRIAFDNLERQVKAHDSVSAAYLIWRKPFMVAGGDTFIHDMMRRAGWTNVFANQKRYPTCSAEALMVLNPQYLLLSSEPYPFSQKHVDELKLICPNAQILLVDGEMFSWYGSRLLPAASYFSGLILDKNSVK